MNFNEHHLRTAADILFPESRVIEVRVPKAGRFRTISGYFELPEQIDALVAEVAKVSGLYAGVYWTFNPVDPSLLALGCNRLKPYQEVTSGDADVQRRVWLPLDIDPVRKTGISSSEEEKALARAMIIDVRKWLCREGWALPVVGDSGNGYHGFYRIDLPNDMESRDLCKAVLEGLALKFNTERVKIDTSVCNASRIMKIPGTLACKGDSIPSRPHRMCALFQPPAEIIAVSKKQLAAVAALAPRSETKKSVSATEGGGWTQELVEAAMDKAGISYKKALSYKGGLKWQHGCLKDESHGSPDAWTQLDQQGWVSSNCSHDSCGGGMNSRDWADALDELADSKIERPARAHNTTLDDVKKMMDTWGMAYEN